MSGFLEGKTLKSKTVDLRDKINETDYVTDNTRHKDIVNVEYLKKEAILPIRSIGEGEPIYKGEDGEFSEFYSVKSPGNELVIHNDIDKDSLVFDVAQNLNIGEGFALYKDVWYNNNNKRFYKRYKTITSKTEYIVIKDNGQTLDLDFSQEFKSNINTMNTRIDNLERVISELTIQVNNLEKVTSVLTKGYVI